MCVLGSGGANHNIWVWVRIETEMQTADTDVSIALRGEGINESRGHLTTSVDAISAQAVLQELAVNYVQFKLQLAKRLRPAGTTTPPPGTRSVKCPLGDLSASGGRELHPRTRPHCRFMNPRPMEKHVA